MQTHIPLLSVCCALLLAGIALATPLARADGGVDGGDGDVDSDSDADSDGDGIGWGSPECWADEPDATPDAAPGSGSNGGCAVVAPGSRAPFATLLSTLV